MRTRSFSPSGTNEYASSAPAAARATGTIRCATPRASDPPGERSTRTALAALAAAAASSDASCLGGGRASPSSPVGGGGGSTPASS